MSSKTKLIRKIEPFKLCERDYFQRLMTVAKGNMDKAVELSGLSKTTIYRKIAEHGVQRPH